VTRIVEIATALIAVLAVAGCNSEPMQAPLPLAVRGIEFSRKLVAADSARLAQFGRVISVVRVDSVIVMLTNATGSDIVSAPGIVGMCQSLGSDSSASVEVEVGAGPTGLDSAAAIVAKLGRVHLVDSTLAIVDGMVPAFRLREFDDYPALTYVYVVICPYFQTMRAFQSGPVPPPNTRLPSERV
jgi:hypothetical protein